MSIMHAALEAYAVSVPISSEGIDGWGNHDRDWQEARFCKSFSCLMAAFGRLFGSLGPPLDAHVALFGPKARFLTFFLSMLGNPYLHFESIFELLGTCFVE